MAPQAHSVPAPVRPWVVDADDREIGHRAATQRPQPGVMPRLPSRKRAACPAVPSPRQNRPRPGIAAVGSSDAGADRLDVDRLELLRQLVASASAWTLAWSKSFAGATKSLVSTSSGAIGLLIWPISWIVSKNSFQRAKSWWPQPSRFAKSPRNTFASSIIDSVATGGCSVEASAGNCSSTMWVAARGLRWPYSSPIAQARRYASYSSFLAGSS